MLPLRQISLQLSTIQSTGDDWTLGNGTIYDYDLIIFTNWRNDVTKDQLLNWYKENLTQYGWQYDVYNSSTSNYFKLVSRSTDSSLYRKATVWAYSDPAKGWAIRIIYGSSASPLP